MNGRAKTIIDAQGASDSNIFYIGNNETSSTVIQGLTLTGGNRDYDGGAIIASGTSPLLVDLSIEANSAAIGGGVSIKNNANPVIINTRFLGNTATGTQPDSGRGGAISIDGSSSATIIYSVFSGNSARLGGAISSDSGSTLLINNSTISGNYSLEDAGGIYLEGSTSTITNSILWNNGSEIKTVATATASVSYSAVEGGFPGTGNTSLDPLFMAPASNDFMPSPASPLIDAGVDLNYQSDHAGNLLYDVPYVADTGNTGLYVRTYIDIGALEYDACTDNPAQGPDSDSDGLGNDCDPDDDNDGLPDSIEITIGTNPLLVDTDGDGLSDYDEAAWNGIPTSYTLRADLNPLSDDSDGDGFNDGMEVASGYSPLNSADFPVWGDINNDRRVDAADMLIASRAMHGLVALTSGELARCNVAPLVNGKPETLYNGDCDIADLLLIQRKAIGAVQY